MKPFKRNHALADSMFSCLVGVVEVQIRGLSLRQIHWVDSKNCCKQIRHTKSIVKAASGARVYSALPSHSTVNARYLCAALSTTFFVGE